MSSVEADNLIKLCGRQNARSPLLPINEISGHVTRGSQSAERTCSHSQLFRSNLEAACSGVWRVHGASHARRHPFKSAHVDTNGETHGSGAALLHDRSPRARRGCGRDRDGVGGGRLHHLPDRGGEAEEGRSRSRGRCGREPRSVGAGGGGGGGGDPQLRGVNRYTSCRATGVWLEHSDSVQ